jgi:hypothetical protein
MATSNFKIFDENKGNIMDDGSYGSDYQRLNGVTQGVARSNLHNKMYLQATIMCSALADFIVSKGMDALDSDYNTLASNLSQSLTPEVRGTFGTATGTAPNLNVTIPGIHALENGLQIYVALPSVSAGTAYNLNVNGLGSKPMVNFLKGTLITAGDPRTISSSVWGLYYSATDNAWIAITYVPYVSPLQTPFGTCANVATDVNKTVSVPGFPWDVPTNSGNVIYVTFTNGSTAANPTLNVNGTGAIPIYNSFTNSAIGSDVLPTGHTAQLMWANSRWYLINPRIVTSGTLTTTSTTSLSAATNEALSGSVNLHKIAKTGNYSDLVSAPGIPSVGSLSTTSTTALGTSASESFGGSISLHKVAKTGTYGDLISTPTIPAAPGTLTTTSTTALTATTSEALSGAINLHKVAKTGTYNDLVGRPTIPNAPLIDSTTVSWIFSTSISGPGNDVRNLNLTAANMAVSNSGRISYSSSGASFSVPAGCYGLILAEIDYTVSWTNGSGGAGGTLYSQSTFNGYNYTYTQVGLASTTPTVNIQGGAAFIRTVISSMGSQTIQLGSYSASGVPSYARVSLQMRNLQFIYFS